MKKLLVLATCILSVVALGAFCACSKDEPKEKTDAIKFKEEYESLNGQKNSSGVEYRKVNISEDNPFVYAEAKDIVEAINNKETFAVYFGFKSCPWCRSAVETLIKVADDLHIKKIYYVDVLDLRDTYELQDNKAVKVKDGGEGYDELLQALDNVLSDYTLTNSKGKQVSTGEKRIYAPNIVSVVDGVPQKLTTGLSESQTDAYMELTEEMLTEMYDSIDCVLDCLGENKVCNQGC